MLKSALSKKDDIIFDLLQIVSSFKDKKNLIRNEHDVRESPLVQTSQLQTHAEQGRHENEGTTITSADNCTVWEVPRNPVQSVNPNHSLSKSGQAIYSLRPSTLAQWQYGYNRSSRTKS